MDTKTTDDERLNAPFLAFACTLLLVLTGDLCLQTLGFIGGLPLAGASMFLAIPFALLLTYGYGFRVSEREIFTGLLLAGLLAGIGIVSRNWLDFTADGLGYQQSAAEAILNGWNPFTSDSEMFWQNIYPSAAARSEASLAFLYRSIEDTKMLQIWWLFIALPVFLAGLRKTLGGLNLVQTMLAALCVLSTTTLNQMLTHYVDSYTYLCGLTFIGGLLLYGETRRSREVASVIMTACILYIVNIKLTGIYHAVMLCAGAVLYLGARNRRLPWKLAFLLCGAWWAGVLIVGFRPYVTNAVSYGLLLHYFPSPDQPMEVFSGQQRPSSFDGLPGFVRYWYSLFSITGGAPHEPAQLKWPWTIHPLEWKFSGDPDARTGGFGPLYALGFLLSLAMFAVAVLKKIPFHKPLALLAFVCLIFSAAFAQSWWARYVPFGYAVPFILLLSLPHRRMPWGLAVVALVFLVNSAMAGSAALAAFKRDQRHFQEVVLALRAAPAGSVYLVPPVPDYKKYNGAYMPLQRRLKAEGIETSVRAGANCPHPVETYSEFTLCY